MTKWLMVVLPLLWAGSAWAQSRDDYNGYWWTEDRSGIIELVVTEQGIEGLTRWGKEQNTDKFNPDPALRSRSLRNITFLWGFIYQPESNQWHDGQVYDPKNGKTYSAKMELSKNANELEMRGYIGISLFGRTATFSRVKAEELPAELQ